MQSNHDGLPVNWQKKLIITFLFILAAGVCLSGIYFSIRSITLNISIQVLNSHVPGVVFGIVVLYLGIRFMMMLFDLKKELYKPTSRFSWSNFRKNGKSKK